MASTQFFARSTNGVDLPSMKSLRAIRDGDVVRINIPIKAKNPAAPKFESAWIVVEDGGCDVTMDGYPRLGSSGEPTQPAKKKLTGTIVSDLVLEPFHGFARGTRLGFDRDKVVEIIPPDARWDAVDGEVAR